MHPLLQRRRQLAVVLQAWSVFFSSRFSAVISAMTFLSRCTSAWRRCSWASGRPSRSSKTRPAEESNFFFQP
jgi:hypothetical protein